MPIHLGNHISAVWSTQSIFVNIINVSNVCHHEINKHREVEPIWKNVETNRHSALCFNPNHIFFLKSPVDES